MPEIKTRGVVQGTIKTLDRSAVVGERMKNAYVKTKDKAEHSVYAAESSPEEYAADCIRDTATGTAQEVAYHMDKQRQKFIRRKAQERRQGTIHQDTSTAEAAPPSANDSPSAPQPTVPDAVPQQEIRPPRQGRTNSLRPDIKTIERSSEKIRQRVISGKPVKSADRTIKTADRTVKTAARASEAMKQTAQQSAKAAAVATQKAQVAMKATAAAVKTLAAATAKAVKAMIAALEQLVSAIMAGGWVALVLIILILMVGCLASSAFGIFFNSESEEDKIQDVLREINTAYEYRLDAIEGANPHDEVEMCGSRASWSEILAVYAVRATTDPDNPLDVVTMDEERKEILEEVFWDMNEIDFATETRTETEMQEIEDENGNLVETPVDVDKDYLMITVSHKPPEEMAALYGFDDDRREQLEQLLDEEFASMWLSVLYGVRVGESDIVAVALSQLGNVGGELYWSWYGFTSREEWCACFVSWCADVCGYIEADKFPRFSGTEWGVYWFRSRGLWADKTITPLPGMIIFFDLDNKGHSGPQDGVSDHVGIVEKVENGIVYTIEGNSGDACRQCSYPVGYYEIWGYGMPKY